MFTLIVQALSIQKVWRIYRMRIALERFGLRRQERIAIEDREWAVAIIQR